MNRKNVSSSNTDNQGLFFLIKLSHSWIMYLLPGDLKWF